MIDVTTIDRVIAEGPYSDSWETLTRMQVPAWFTDAKFGIFTHWGLYSVPEFSNEWYSRNMYIKGYPAYEHHRETYGPQKSFGYKDFIPRFTGEKFNADEWLSLFEKAGAKYYFPVAEHHDGFQMYPSELSHYNVAEMGPRRDVLGELKTATLAHGLHFATSNHRAEHWWFMGHGTEFDSDVKEPLHRGDFYWPAQPEPDNQDITSTPYPTAEFLEDWMLRVCELIDAYKPELLYFDWWVQHVAFKPYLRKVAAFYYNRGIEWGMQTAICYKQDGMAWGAGLVDIERGNFSDPKPFVWQTDMSVARNSWSYTDSLEYKSAPEIVTALIDAVSKNGNLLLNVGPRADGSIAPRDREILTEIGDWLAVNGEGIYGTRPWKIAQEGPTVLGEGEFQDQKPVEWTPHDVRFTAKNGAIYAFFLSPAVGSAPLIRNFAHFSGTNPPAFHGAVRSVTQLGVGEVSFDVTDEGLRLPPLTHAHNMPIGYKIMIE